MTPEEDVRELLQSLDPGERQRIVVFFTEVMSRPDEWPTVSKLDLLPPANCLPVPEGLTMSAGAGGEENDG